MSARSDRVLGLIGNSAIKVPCKVATVSNITLSGEQTIDGVAVVEKNAAGIPDRVLVKNQTNAVQNGIYNVKAQGAWERSDDFNGSFDVVSGTLVTTLQGTANAPTTWKLTTADPITIGTTALAFGAPSFFLTDVSGQTVVSTKGTAAVTLATHFDRPVTPVEFGGIGNGVADDTAAINAAIAEVKSRYDSTAQSYRAYLDLDGGSWKVTSSINVTGILQPGFRIANGDIYGVLSNRPVLDLSGSINIRLQNMRIIGDGTTTPSCGILRARADRGGGNFAAAGNHHFDNVTVQGFFTKAAEINLASEVCTHVNCRLVNRSRSLTAYAYVSSGYVSSLNTYIGGIASDHAVLPTSGNYSNIGDNFYGGVIHRQADVNVTITGITKANPAVLSCSPTDLTAAGLNNGDKIWIVNVAGMTQVNYFVHTIANINNGAGTFELQGVDSTAYDTFVSGTFQNQTGPASLLAFSTLLNVDGVYLLTYGSPIFRADMQEAELREMTLLAQLERDPPAIIEFMRTTATPQLVRGLKIQLNQASQVAKDQYFLITGGGDIRVERGDIEVGVIPQDPTNKLFHPQGDWAFRDVDISVDSETAMNDPNNFIEFTGSIRNINTARMVHHISRLRLKSASGALGGMGIRASADQYFAYSSREATERGVSIAERATQTQLRAVGDAVNTTGKFTAKNVWDTTNNRPVWARGATAGDVWVDGQGATVHTPV